VEEESGKKIFEKVGLLVYGNPQTSIVYKGTAESADKFKIPVEKLSSAAANKRFPLYRAPADTAAVFEPGAGFLHVELATITHVELARRKGATINEGEKVLKFEATSAGVKVTTDKNSYVAAKLIVAGGGWNKILLKELKLELFRLLAFWFRASSAHDLKNKIPCFAFHLDDFYYGFPMLDGKTVKIAAHFAKTPIQDPAEKEIKVAPQELVQKMCGFVERCLPSVSLEIERFSPCIYTMTADENFVIDKHPTLPNVYVAAGFSGHGYKFATVVGEILAELAVDGQTRQPIDFLRLRDCVVR
jgi:monomeric sarcosine oxidase